MSHHDLMQDPAFTPIMFEIECGLHDADVRAQEAGIALSDGQVNSIVNKALSFYSGKKAKMPEPKTDRDRVLHEIYTDLTALRAKLNFRDADTEGPVPARLANKILVASLKAIRESIKTQRSPESGSRDYLDFLCGFVAEAREGAEE